MTKQPLQIVDFGEIQVKCVWLCKVCAAGWIPIKAFMSTSFSYSFENEQPYLVYYATRFLNYWWMYSCLCQMLQFGFIAGLVCRCLMDAAFLHKPSRNPCFIYLFPFVQKYFVLLVSANIAGSWMTKKKKKQKGNLHLTNYQLQPTTNAKQVKCVKSIRKAGNIEQLSN